MPSRLTANLILLCAVVVLALFLSQAAYRKTLSDSKKAQLVLGTQSPAAIRHIRIQRPGKDTIIMERKEGQWHITQPIQVPAAAQRVRAVLKVLATPSINRFPAPQHRLQAFGFGADSVQLYLDDQTFRFGGTESIYARRYILHAGYIHLMEDYLYPQLVQAAPFFATKQASRNTDSTAETPRAKNRLSNREWVWPEGGNSTPDSAAP